MDRYQKTIKEPFTLEGIGIHTGSTSRVYVEPGDADQGIVFHKDGAVIPALAQNVIRTVRCTTLGKDGVEVQTVEHFMAACYALGIDSLNVRVEGKELPIMDGSSREMALCLEKAGSRELDGEISRYKIKDTIHVSSGNSFMAGIPCNSFIAACLVDYNHPMVGVQAALFQGDSDDFTKNIAPARTFGFWEEIKDLLEQELARGGTLDNALIIKQDGYMGEPRFPDEVVRHKLLDVIGDLALTGARIEGHIFAYKPSHSINVEFVRKLVAGK